MLSYYREAQRLAQREFRACTAKGRYPYLPVLDDFVPADRFSQCIDLGVVQVPLEFVVGTRTSGRTNAFARNFLPLMEEGTEFAGKWQALCKAHLDEGIRDPIKAYEYLGRYYVQEGNKRVSVLKFFEADTLYAQVLRILPEQTGQPEILRYDAFVDFYKCSRVNFIEFSKAGSYAQLQRFVGKQPGEVWSEDDRRDLRGAYYAFREAYLACGGKKLASTVGDAMLAYIKIYGYAELRSSRPAALKKTLPKIWEEITLQQEADPIDLKLHPEEERELQLPRSPILTALKPKAAPLRVAFIHDKTPTTSGWTYGHELGREHVERVFGGEVTTVPYYNALDGDPLAVIEEAISDGCTTIFTTSPRLLPASLRAAVDNPKITILNCSLNKSHRYIRTYYARMYEAKFIIGAVAGAMAGGGPVGYICDYPIFGQVAGINAFAQGVQLVNPRTTVYLEWSSAGGLEAATKRLTDRGISLISSQDQANLENPELHNSFGLSLVGEGKPVHLAMPVWRWGVYYETILRRIRNKSFQSEYERSSRALGYYWGLSADVIAVLCSGKVPDGAKKLANLLRDGICSGICDPFRGPIYAQDGRKMLDTDDCLTPEQVANMDWLVDGIVGAIPAYEELSDIGKATVGIVGVEAATRATNEI